MRLSMTFSDMCLFDSTSSDFSSFRWKMNLTTKSPKADPKNGAEWNDLLSQLQINDACKIG